MGDRRPLLANFMDSALSDLEAKGNLESAGPLYNPDRFFDRVVHFSPFPEDIRYQPALRSHGIEIATYGRRRGSRLEVLARLVRVFRALRSLRPDVIRGRLPYIGSLIACLCGRVLRIPSVVSLGGDNRLAQELSGEYRFGSRRLSWWVEKATLLLANRIIVPNRFTSTYVEDIIGRRRARDRIRIVPWILGEPPGVPAELPANVDRGRPTVAVIGFVNRYKFSDVMFDVAEAADRLPGAPQFVFCGDGPLRVEGERRLVHKGHAAFLGWQDAPVVHALLEAADVVAVPMSGFVLLEAARLGKPVVAGDREWHSEIVEPGKSGQLVDPSSADQWLVALERLLTSPHHAQELGEELHRRYKRSYAADTARTKEIAVYEELLAPVPARVSADHAPAVADEEDV